MRSFSAVNSYVLGSWTGFGWDIDREVGMLRERGRGLTVFGVFLGPSMGLALWSTL